MVVRAVAVDVVDLDVHARAALAAERLAPQVHLADPAGTAPDPRVAHGARGAQRVGLGPQGALVLRAARATADEFRAAGRRASVRESVGHESEGRGMADPFNSARVPARRSRSSDPNRTAASRA